MAVKYIVKSEVVDVNNDIPQSGDIFFVDSNIWIFITNYYEPNEPNIEALISYIYKAIDNGAKLYHSSLILPEIMHTVERKFFEFYKTSVENITLKEYRHNLPDERKTVLKEIKSAWDEICDLSEQLSFKVDDQITSKTLEHCRKFKLDGYDYFLHQNMQKDSILKIITNDGDFATVDNIKVFTTNPNVISLAKKYDRLICRQK